MMRDRLMRALRGEPTDTTPIWLMRQAGRYLPGYRALRRQRSILEIAQSPSLAAEVTLEPLRRFDVDAAVVFADIALPFAGLGVDFRIEPGAGPVVPEPVRTDADVERLRPFDAEASVGFVGDTIRAFRAQETGRPIIGFSGAPFTLASYLIEGGASRELPETRRMLYSSPERFGRLLDRLTELAIGYLALQARAGAAALQLFDTWAGMLGPAEYGAFVAPRLRTLFAALAPLGRPTIYFSTGSTHLLDTLGTIGASAVSLDWRVPLDVARDRLGPGIALQGNLDPGALLGSPTALERSARRVLASVPTHRGHVFNLGHGVLPATDPDRVGALVDLVHAEGREVAA